MIASLICLVVGISDGDTLKARCGEPGAYEQIKIRVSAIDAPEKAQPWGQRSRQHLAEMCLQQQAKIAPIAKDRYGRTIAEVECQGRDVGAEQVRAGMAWVYTRYAIGRIDLEKLQVTARTERRGLWLEREQVPPWDWRKQTRADK